LGWVRLGWVRLGWVGMRWVELACVGVVWVCLGLLGPVCGLVEVRNDNAESVTSFPKRHREGAWNVFQSGPGVDENPHFDGLCSNGARAPMHRRANLRQALEASS
jgi:hypothetical protein